MTALRLSPVFNRMRSTRARSRGSTLKATLAFLLMSMNMSYLRLGVNATRVASPPPKHRSPARGGMLEAAQETGIFTVLMLGLV
jgi:hypothetical protein